jgi:hypothetical protein
LLYVDVLFTHPTTLRIFNVRVNKNDKVSPWGRGAVDGNRRPGFESLLGIRFFNGEHSSAVVCNSFNVHCLFVHFRNKNIGHKNIVKNCKLRLKNESFEKNKLTSLGCMVSEGLSRTESLLKC